MGRCLFLTSTHHHLFRAVVSRNAPSLPLRPDHAVIVASTYCGVGTMKMKTKMVSACGTFYPLKRPTCEQRGEPGSSAAGGMLSNQGLGKTQPTTAKLRNHLQLKEPDGFCLDLLRENPKQRILL